MSHTHQSKESVVDSLEERANPDRIEKLLAEAMKHPGVADVMRVYSSFEEADKAQAAYRYFQTPFYPQGVSTSSGAALR